MRLSNGQGGTRRRSTAEQGKHSDLWPTVPAADRFVNGWKGDDGVKLPSLPLQQRQMQNSRTTCKPRMGFFKCLGGSSRRSRSQSS